MKEKFTPYGIVIDTVNFTNIATDEETQAEVNRKIAASLTPELIEKIKFKKWDGQLPTVQGDTATIVDITS